VRESTVSSTPPTPGSNIAILYICIALHEGFCQIAHLREHAHRRPKEDRLEEIHGVT